jgi:hypothetical protein
VTTAAQPVLLPRFVRRTRLAADEYHKNFHKLDADIIAAVTSAEADRVTPLMSKIYLRLVNAPDGCWERDGVLRFESELREVGQVKAWLVLCEVLGVASATANKALRWMHEQGIIGYFAGKNGVGIRIFLNRASSSVGKKILPFPPASSGARRASPDETTFMDSFADSDVLDPDLNSRAPKNGAETNREVKTLSEPKPEPASQPDRRPHSGSEAEETRPAQVAATVPVDEIVRRLRDELEPCVRAAAAQAAAHEHERTRQWLEKSGIPKATRVAQHEAYNVLRSHGLINSSAGRVRAGLEVGRAGDDCATAAKPLTPEEIAETAETCVAFLETQGKSIDVTLSEISSEGGGWLLPQDAPKVREAAQALLRERAERR